MEIPFIKFHGFGNDYIVIERSDIPAGIDLSALAIGICNRHTGAGSDGIAVLKTSADSDADLDCEIVNPDGSIAGFSGNGTRCAVAYAYRVGLWIKDTLRLRTRSGIKNYRLLEKIEPAGYWFEAEIGKPKFASSDIPVLTEEPHDAVTSLPVTAGDRTFEMACVNVGNPVAITFVDDFEFDWRSYGRELEVHPSFPEKANIVFVKVIDDANIEIRIWERAAGETSSSGTCSSGAAVLAAFTGRTGRTVSVHAVGGTTEFKWLDSGEMTITGRADLSYFGEWPIAE